MTQFKNLSLFLVILIIFTSCNTMSDVGKVMRNEKVKTTDEFLVKKKEPLTLPPDYDKLPEPGSKKEKQTTTESKKIEEIFKIEKENNQNTNSKKDSLEETILKKIEK